MSQQPNPQPDNWRLIPGNTVHFTVKVGAAFCGSTPTNDLLMSSNALTVTCPHCLTRMAQDDPLLLLDPQEAKLIRDVRRLKQGNDIGLFVSWTNDFLRCNRVLKARFD